MKKTLVLCLMVAIVAVSGQAFAGWAIPGVSTGSAPAVDVNALTARSTVIKHQVANASIALGNGLVEILNACGKKTESVRLQATIDAAKSSKDDTEKTKQLITDENTASNEVNNMDLQSQMDKTMAQKSLGKSMLFLGSGALCDASAVVASKGLVTDTTKAISNVKSSPTSYGPSALTNLSSALSAANFTVENVPPQMNTTQELMKNLNKYAQTNKIELPSQTEMEKSAKDMDKQ